MLRFEMHSTPRWELAAFTRLSKRKPREGSRAYPIGHRVTRSAIGSSADAENNVKNAPY